MAGSELSTPELYAARLVDPHICMGNISFILSSDILDFLLEHSVEVYQNADYNRFLQALMPVLTKMLTDEQPVFDSNSEEQ
ncbi:174_t:CDS:2, partial [Scutellospora calospora]